MFATSEEAYWEMEQERTAPLATLASEHADWHAVNGWSNGCPLDCAAADPHEEPVSFYLEVFSPGFCSGETYPVGDVPTCGCHYVEPPF